MSKILAGRYTGPSDAQSKIEAIEFQAEVRSLRHGIEPKYRYSVEMVEAELAMPPYAIRRHKI